MKNRFERCYHLTEFRQEDFIAVNKPRADICNVLQKNGSTPFNIRKNLPKGNSLACKAIKYFVTHKNWIDAYRTIDKDSVLFLQIPFQTRTFGNRTLAKLKKNKNVKLVYFVHDVTILRADIVKYNYETRDVYWMLNNADVIIAHNQAMIDEFIKLGFPKQKLVSLEVFDYLSESSTFSKKQAKKSLVIAGNLAKTDYLKPLIKELALDVELYGPNYDTRLGCEKVKYHGKFPAEELIKKINSGYGLLWEDDNLDYSSSYSKINNPHKLSLYIACGLPLVIWNQAAQLNYVTNHNMGIAVSSLRELENIFDNITDDQYNRMATNAQAEGKKLRKGFYTTRAALQALEILGL